MASEGQEVNRPDGGGLRFVTITEGLLEMEVRYSGRGALPPAHLHPRQEEHFEVVEGAVQAIIEGQRHRYVAGDAFDVPAGAVHQMGGDGPASVKWQIRPALNSAELLEGLYNGTAESDPAAFLASYTEEFRLGKQPA